MQIDRLIAAGVPADNIASEKVSAARAVRPVLEGVLNDLRHGDTLVVYKMDRIARSLIDLIEKMGRIEKAGAGFRSLTEQIDTSTPGGRLIFHVLGALAEFERDLIKERTRTGVKAAMARGVRFGVEPKLSGKQVEQAQKQRDRGDSIRLIASRFGVSHNTIRNWTVGPTRRRIKSR